MCTARAHITPQEDARLLRVGTCCRCCSLGQARLHRSTIAAPLLDCDCRLRLLMSFQRIASSHHAWTLVAGPADTTLLQLTEFRHLASIATNSYSVFQPALQHARSVACLAQQDFGCLVWRCRKDGVLHFRTRHDGAVMNIVRAFNSRSLALDDEHSSTVLPSASPASSSEGETDFAITLHLSLQMGDSDTCRVSNVKTVITHFSKLVEA